MRTEDESDGVKEVGKVMTTFHWEIASIMKLFCENGYKQIKMN